MNRRRALLCTFTFVFIVSGTISQAPLLGGQRQEPERSEVNLAIYAKPSTSFVSGHETLKAIHDGSTPSRSDDYRYGAYGNWPRRGRQWVQYDWPQPISTSEAEVYWWDDHRGVRMPTAYRLLYWHDGNFVPVESATEFKVESHQFNSMRFKEITTTKLRLEFDSQQEYSTGILEWRVIDSGKSPKFPPIVDAGRDRFVMVGGRSYLEGQVDPRPRSPEAGSIRWTKKSGPGQVTFDDASRLNTWATFSGAGTYRLELTASEGEAEATASLTVTAIDPPGSSELRPIETEHYSIDSPLWDDRLKALIVTWIPHCVEKISDPGLKEGGLNNFVNAARAIQDKPHGQHRGYAFSNAWVFNTIESICLALMVDAEGDDQIIAAQASLHRSLNEWIPKVLAAQEPDGYLQTAFTLSNRQRWSPRHRGDHEGYVAGYFLESAIAHHLMTRGKDHRLYDAAKRLADCWERNIGPSPKRAWYDGHQAMEIALVRFGRYVNRVEGAGHGDRYIALAKFLLDCRQDGAAYDQSHVPVIKQYEAVGHAVRAAYSYAAMADIALETENTDYQSAVMSLWNNIVNRKYYVTGGIGSGETSEGFGPDYSLRPGAYCESCSSCGEIFFQHKINLMYQDARYADLYEETLFNALLGSIDLAGENFYYTNPLDQRDARHPWHVCPCCIGNIPRTLLMLPTWAYSKDSRNIYVNLFVGSNVSIHDVAGTDVELVQKTHYPWHGSVAITVNPKESTEFAIRIRLPDRNVSELYHREPPADGFEWLTINGQQVAATPENGYAVLKRQWSLGDRIELAIPMKIQRIKAIDKIEATRGRVALQYGPLVYCVERYDQDIDKILSPEVSLQTKWRPDLLHGVMVLTGSWQDGSPLLAVPYYARHNRDPMDNSSGNQNRNRGNAVISRVWIRDQK
jgi:DUF1680 family protein